MGVVALLAFCVSVAVSHPALAFNPVGKQRRPHYLKVTKRAHSSKIISRRHFGDLLYEGHLKKPKQCTPPLGYHLQSEREFYAGDVLHFGGTDFKQFGVGLANRHTRLESGSLIVESMRTGISPEIDPDLPWFLAEPYLDIGRVSSKVVRRVQLFGERYREANKTYWDFLYEAERFTNQGYALHNDATRELVEENAMEVNTTRDSATTTVVRLRGDPKKIVTTFKVNQNIQLLDIDHVVATDAWLENLRTQFGYSLESAPRVDLGFLNSGVAPLPVQATLLLRHAYLPTRTPLQTLDPGQQKNLYGNPTSLMNHDVTAFEELFNVTLARRFENGVSAVLEPMHWSVNRAFQMEGVVETWLAIQRQAKTLEDAYGLKEGVDIRFLADTKRKDLFLGMHAAPLHSEPLLHPETGKGYFVMGVNSKDIPLILKDMRIRKRESLPGTRDRLERILVEQGVPLD